MNLIGHREFGLNCKIFQYEDNKYDISNPSKLSLIYWLSQRINTYSWISKKLNNNSKILNLLRESI